MAFLLVPFSDIHTLYVAPDGASLRSLGRFLNCMQVIRSQLLTSYVTLNTSQLSFKRLKTSWVADQKLPSGFHCVILRFQSSNVRIAKGDYCPRKPAGPMSKQEAMFESIHAITVVLPLRQWGQDNYRYLFHTQG